MDDFHTLTITPRQQHKHNLSTFCLRGLFNQVKAFHVILVLLCTLLCFSMCGSCLTHGLQKPAEYDSCGSYGDNGAVGFQDISVGDTSFAYAAGSSMTLLNFENICTNSHSFCFLSTLPGFSSKEHKLKVATVEVSGSPSDGSLFVGSIQGSRWAENKSWPLDYGMFQLLNGQTVSCSMNSREDVDELSSMQTNSCDQCDPSSCKGPLLTQKRTSVRLRKKSEMMKSSSFDASPPNVEISPPVLDWGQRHLYFPSVASLTVANTCNDSILHVYEPFSTDTQFYTCNSSEVLVGPGEAASICFVFLPRWLGLSSAHLILQTSSGGFLVQVKGYAVESPYNISPLSSLDTPSSGRLRKNFSLLNPFDEILYVKEVNAWISVSQGNISHHSEAICSLENLGGPDGLSLLGFKDWLVVRSAQNGFPWMAMRPQENWEIGPHSSETIMEIDFSVESEGNVVGAFCMQLLRSSQDRTDTVMFPLELELDGKVAYNGISGSVSFETLVPYDVGNTVVVAIALRNRAPHVLSVVKIREVAAAKVFQIKYIEGLLLFPSTVTQVATVTCTQLLVELHDSPSEMSNMNKDCKLVLLTNDSSTPQIEIPCQNIFHVCLKRQKDSFIGYDNHSDGAETGNRRTGSLGSGKQSLSDIKALEMAEADEFVLANWKSQGSTSGMSVLDDHEVLFPMVQVGTYHPRWITVKNPSEHPVVMQLILNSGEIIDECRGTDGSLEPPPSNIFVHTELTSPTGYGFSMAESALTEAYVHPYGKAYFGPIFFYPSNRCGWRSSALIRNNLSGVEWLSLRGFGGSLSLVLLDGSEPVQVIEFNLPMPLNISRMDGLFNMEETTYICSVPSSKELYAKNMGDLPLEVKSIEVSGSECGVDGFMVHTCKGFSLEPGESTKLLISYQSDFSAAMVHRDLELALASGILVIPIKASLPLYMYNLCKKSVFWMRLKKFSAAVLLATSLMILIFCCVFPQVIAFGSLDYYFNSKESSSTTVGSAGKASHMHRNQRKSKFSESRGMDRLLSSVHRNQRKSKFSESRGMDCLLSSVGEDKASNQESIGKYADGHDGALEQGLTIKNLASTPENHKQGNIFSYTEEDKSVAVENSDTLNSPQPLNLTVLNSPQPLNLTVRTGKEKGRRRRKRKGVSACLTGLLEVSSSQSGNSTPSSPLSPVSATPNRLWSPSPDIYFSATQERPSVPSKTFNTPAAFPCSGGAAPTLHYSSPLSSTSTSTIAPIVRAPGPKLLNQRSVEVDEKVGGEYTYDIWGDHFSGLHLAGSLKDTTMKTIATEGNSDTFFVRGPQALMEKSQSNSL
ncbi:PREDICTED: uncharacterized protein LOC105135826 isoform X2 [Populus euphratica]|uniref:Uncharacterized protein LOC105135826 isoform X2 n=1 Tax=Populus euphratica TaxID=75702 RepID=A0AAJ6V0X0_POPEU|nr:PREDICTED: uncharacterized protein LOC105135826 isoform X2 [Populus euphratica]